MFWFDGLDRSGRGTARAGLRRSKPARPVEVGNLPRRSLSGAACVERETAPGLMSTTTVSPAAILPRSRCSESWSSVRLVITRRSGRAPKTRSWLSLASRSLAAPVTSSSMICSVRCLCSRPSWRSTICRICSVVRLLKTTTASTRLRNSGRNIRFSSSSIFSFTFLWRRSTSSVWSSTEGCKPNAVWAWFRSRTPRVEVMMMTVLRS